MIYTYIKDVCHLPQVIRSSSKLETQRMLRFWTLAPLLALALGAPAGEDHDLNFVVKNLTALWEEVSDIRQEIVRHLHEGHKEDNHDEVVREVEGLHHEHHVHHLHHPHVGHNDHHSDELLMHLEGVHGHIDNHTAGQPVHGHLHGHGPSHDHVHGPPKAGGHDDDDDDSHEGDDDDHDDDGHDHDDHDHDDHDHDERTGHRVLHPNPDEHDAHGLHSHEDEHEYGHEHDHDHVSDDVDRHGHHDHDDHSQGDRHGGHGGPPSRPGAPGAPGAPGMVRPGLAPLPGSLRSGRHPSDSWMHASCTLKPNIDVPTSNVHGSVIISQRKDGKGPVYFDIHLSGIDVANTGRIHGFHVHERPVTGDSCGSTGGHFNPTGATHGAPSDEVRHVGDLGNVEVTENGELRGYVIHDDKVAFDGAKGIVGKALVVHAGVDDLGLGGDAGSLTTGNAGGRLACCTIHMGAHLRHKDLVTFRIKG
ncbi:uncharacterized protein [Macrobrachium rosenbergii]|uniref:uncharacterized protein isoform X2 n=1 Tax=Macrobrachium rosenbergii TaxID=79674 RepID=UPI0034D6A813